MKNKNYKYKYKERKRNAFQNARNKLDNLFYFEVTYLLTVSNNFPWLNLFVVFTM